MRQGLARATDRRLAVLAREWMTIRRCHLLAVLLLLFALQQSQAMRSAPRAPAFRAVTAEAPKPAAVEQPAPVETIAGKANGRDPAPARQRTMPPVSSSAPVAPESGRPAGKAPEAPPEPTLKGPPPESFLAAPETELAMLGTKYDTVVQSRTSGPSLQLAWEYRQNPQGKIVGFEFSNRGGNRILPQLYNVDKNLFFTRDFQFRFDDRARQDIHLFVTDWAPSRDKQFRLSELMNSVLHFFPRKYIPAIALSGGRSVVTLPTGEGVEFDLRTREIMGGAFAEAPVDLNPDKSARRFAGIDYVGKGLIVRADARGTDPRLGTTATISSAPAADCAGSGCRKICRVPSQELWEQKGAVHFKFSSDEDFDRYLAARCGFGIPKTGADSEIALQ